MAESLERTRDVAGNVARIVEAYVAKNSVSAAELPALIAGVHAALTGAVVPNGQEALENRPAVPVGKSITHTHVACLECGKRFKSIRGHLRSAHDLTPDAYRQKWELRPDYPMVAPEYASIRSRLSKEFGLGGRQTSGAAKAVGGKKATAKSSGNGKAASATGRDEKAAPGGNGKVRAAPAGGSDGSDLALAGRGKWRRKNAN